MAAAASGRPAPRYAMVGTVFVSTDAAVNDTLGMSYVPVAMRRVMTGKKAPNRGHAPESCTTSSEYASSRPSRVPPNFAYCTWARP